MLHEIESKLQLMFAFRLVGGSFVMLLRIICALPFFLSSLLQYVVKLLLCSLTVLCRLSSHSCLLLRAIVKGVQLLHLYALSVTEAAFSEQSKEGKCWYP